MNLRFLPVSPYRTVHLIRQCGLRANREALTVFRLDGIKAEADIEQFGGEGVDSPRVMSTSYSRWRHFGPSNTHCSTGLPLCS